MEGRSERSEPNMDSHLNGFDKFMLAYAAAKA